MIFATIALPMLAPLGPGWGDVGGGRGCRGMDGCSTVNPIRSCWHVCCLSWRHVHSRAIAAGASDRGAETHPGEQHGEVTCRRVCVWDVVCNMCMWDVVYILHVCFARLKDHINETYF